MYIVGLTGGIGSGKTAVSDFFKHLGITIVDADICARLVVQKGSSALLAIQQHFGTTVTDANGELDRGALRQIIFQDNRQKQWLENLLHPLIGEEINRQLAQSDSPYTVFVSPLLIESKQYLRCDRVLVVDLDETLQIQRASQRDQNSHEQIKAIIKHQTQREQRLSFADDILKNDRDLQHLHQQVAQLHQQYLTYAKTKETSHVIPLP